MKKVWVDWIIRPLVLGLYGGVSGIIYLLLLDAVTSFGPRWLRLALLILYLALSPFLYLGWILISSQLKRWVEEWVDERR